jgi:4-hydroxybenzoate polyprenyltransferase
MNGLRGWIEASHPFPLAGVLCLTALVGVTAKGFDLGYRFGAVLLAMLLSQFAIGWTNDYVDSASDRQHRPEKPVAAGRVEARWLPVASAATLTGSFLTGAALGVLPLVLLIAGSAAGLAYNFRLKDTRWSWAPFIVAFAVLPPFVWSSLHAFRGAYLTLYVAGAPLVVAVHLANALPDIETDAASDRGGAGVRLGRTRTLSLIGATLLLPLLVLGLSLIWTDYEAPVLAGVVFAYVALLALVGLAYRQTGRARLAFRLIVGASVLLAGGWLAAL